MRRSRLGVCSWSLRPAGPAELLDALRRLDIRAVQLALWPLVSEPDRWADAVDVLRGGGIDVVSGMLAMAGEDYTTIETIRQTGGVRPNRTWAENMQRAAAVAQLAASARIPLVTFHAGSIPEDRESPERDAIMHRLGIVADLFGRSGVSAALETGQESAGTLLQALEQLARPNLGVNFDPANMILYGSGDPLAALDLLGPHVRQIHVKDALPTQTPGTWGRETPAGNGAVPWSEFLSRAIRLVPPVDFIIEREGRTGTIDDIAAARSLVALHAGQRLGA
jgi:sugar phosphate isomerase/epimerase